MAGTVSSCVILDQNGDEVLSLGGSFENVEGKISHQALTTLVQLMATGSHNLLPDPELYDIGINLFGLKIRDRLRIMALDALRYISQTEGAEMIASAFWYNRPFETAPFLDPYEVVIPSDLRRDVPYDGLCDFLNIDLPEGVNPDTDARLQADIARRLALKAGLFQL